MTKEWKISELEEKNDAGAMIVCENCFDDGGCYMMMDFLSREYIDNDTAICRKFKCIRCDVRVKIISPV